MLSFSLRSAKMKKKNTARASIAEAARRCKYLGLADVVGSVKFVDWNWIMIDLARPDTSSRQFNKHFIHEGIDSLTPFLFKYANMQDFSCPDLCSRW